MRQHTRAPKALLQALSVALLSLLALAACGEQEQGFILGESAEGDKATFEPVGDVSEAKEDSLQAKRALSVSVDSSSTAVWEVRHEWSDKSSAEANLEGMAWGADSGLTWDEKYALWVASMEKIDVTEGWGDTFTLTTPFGKTLPAPSLECAETSLFLRASFASWYGLPFFIEARDGSGERVFLGHFGFRTLSGRYNNSANFRNNYKDFSELASTWREQGWPSDERLRGRRLGGAQDDEQPALGEGLHAGAYFDEMFLNKRTGYFMIYLLSYFGSVNLADPANTFNIAPEATREGDTLLHRWQRRGIGHTMVVKQVNRVKDDAFEVELVSGSMPRRQPSWESAASSKYSLTSEKGGGHDISHYDDVPYSRLGGGMKRWRTPVNKGGFWVNVVPESDEDVFVQANDYQAIGDRVERFEEVLVELTPELKREAIIERLTAARAHLQSYPASCAARTRREEAFNELYALEIEHFGSELAEVDARYRRLEDYVFAELSYAESKTCCWNSTTNKMYELIMAYAQEELASQGEACVAPTVFKSHQDGYERWQRFAEERGLGAQWVAWSEDERCEQRDAEEDKLSEGWAKVSWTGDLCGAE